MSVTTVNVIMNRIMASETGIAVFRLPGEAQGKLNAIFADSVLTRQWINQGDKNLIGVFDKTCDPKETRATLRAVAMR
jgi:hypothetical protein